VRSRTTSEIPSTSLTENIRWGAKWGLYAAGFFGTWATLVRLASGSRPFDEAGLTYSATIAAYVAFGLLGGMLLVVLRPFTKSQIGSALVGWILAAVVYSGFATLMGRPPWGWSIFMLAVVLLVSLFVGATGGVAHWKRNQRRN